MCRDMAGIEDLHYFEQICIWSGLTVDDDISPALLVLKSYLVTGSIVKTAVCSMKPRKSDVSNCYTSDAMLNGPDILFEQLAAIFRSWLCHGKITPSLLACSFLPLLKSSLKDPANTGS